MKKFCKIIAVIFFLIGIMAAGIFAVILFTPKQDFGSDRYVAALCLIVLMSAVIGTFFLTRKENGPRKVRMIRIVTVIGGLAYFMCLVGILFMARVNSSRIATDMRSYSLVPFRTIKSFVQAYKSGALSRTAVRRNLFGNFILFMPMAWILPVVFRRLRNGLAFTFVMLVGLCLVEYTQYKTGRGSMDIDDVILNYAGAILVFAMLWNKVIRGFMERKNIVSGRKRKRKA